MFDSPIEFGVFVIGCAACLFTGVWMGARRTDQTPVIEQLLKYIAQLQRDLKRHRLLVAERDETIIFQMREQGVPIDPHLVDADGNIHNPLHDETNTPADNPFKDESDVIRTDPDAVLSEKLRRDRELAEHCAVVASGQFRGLKTTPPTDEDTIRGQY